jgi:hypothetical protein
MARYGFAVCQAGPKWQYLTPQHTCPKHTPATPEVTAARRKWLAKL